ncbi:MAG TPA: hypothetical protein VNO79_15920 [Actinomycetota bacterium]|nr:hypothetical protein [Actinomycetota bacterium]
MGRGGRVMSLARRIGRVGALLLLAAAPCLLSPTPALAAPGIALRVRAVPDSGTPGTRIAFRYEVTNTGDEPLLDVAVTDDVVGEVGSVGELRPGRTVRFTAQIVLRGAPIRNVAVAAGTTPAGERVEARAVATVTVIAGAGAGTSAGGLAFTGLPAAVPAAAAGSLALVGAGLLALSRGPMDGERRRARALSRRR